MVALSGAARAEQVLPASSLRAGRDSPVGGQEGENSHGNLPTGRRLNLKDANRESQVTGSCSISVSPCSVN